MSIDHEAKYGGAEVLVSEVLDVEGTYKQLVAVVPPVPLDVAKEVAHGLHNSRHFGIITIEQIKVEGEQPEPGEPFEQYGPEYEEVEASLHILEAKGNSPSAARAYLRRAAFRLGIVAACLRYPEGASGDPGKVLSSRSARLTTALYAMNGIFHNDDGFMRE